MRQSDPTFGGHSTASFSEALWRSDVQRLLPSHADLARGVFDHAVKVLGAEPHQRLSSRAGPSDYQTILRTNLHGAFWLVLDTRLGTLRLYFPDKSDSVSVAPPLLAVVSQARKREKVVQLPANTAVTLDGLLELVEQVHEGAVSYYSRGKDSSDTLRVLFGEPRPDGDALAVPSQALFERLLQNPRCSQCGSGYTLSVFAGRGPWELRCDEHLPKPTPWRHLAARGLPFQARVLVWHRDGGRCVTCGQTRHLTFDHVVPANRGGGKFSGSNCESNLRLKCRACNYSKGNKSIP